ncbi:ACT domain-containing protein [Muriicola marianensis]|uniref:Aspartate kinase n=1 Tax=Muriicola marianensis TaxID=1324801 RepID=A0ABQ1QS82_9FLAO|nr:ACT domain-containing protein [Muriicola marianensis]GGD40301.1 hypothetical protein GCM10011361_04280 [Muriicola marianensis]
MEGKKDLAELVRNMEPVLNEGDYIFATLPDVSGIDRMDILCEFKEVEGTTVVMEKHTADLLKIPYSFVASWITLKVHSALDAVGFTAVFSSELAKHGISANVIAGFYHDHIFVNRMDSQKAIRVLKNLSIKSK